MALTIGTDCPIFARMSDPEITSFRSVVELWPTREDCASDVGATPPQVSKWHQRDRVPAEWWAPLLTTEKAKAAGVTADLLARLAARPMTAADFAEARV